MSSVSSVGAAAGGVGNIGQVIALRQQIIDQSASLQSLRRAGNGGGPGSIDSSGGIGGGAQVPQISPTQPGGGFADTLKSAVDSVNATQLRSSDMNAAYERGDVTDIAQVMMARQESGVAFEATLQVRNKLLSAYQDIMRMGV